MNMIIVATLKGIFRDRVFQGILMISLVFLVIPSVATLSMRQVTELSITLSLSLISFLLLLLSVFLGGTSLWKDIERRYTYGVLGLPLSRGKYILGRFFGTSLFLMITAVVLGAAAYLVIMFTSASYPPERLIIWGNMALFLFFDVLKYIFLVAFAFLFSTVSTSFFLPIFGTIIIFLIGGVTQQVHEYIHSAAGNNLTPFVRHAAEWLYYVLPNFSVFDLKLNAIYGLPIPIKGLFLSICYFCLYTFILLAISSIIFSRKEMR